MIDNDCVCTKDYDVLAMLMSEAAVHCKLFARQQLCLCLVKASCTLQ